VRKAKKGCLPQKETKQVFVGFARQQEGKNSPRKGPRPPPEGKILGRVWLSELKVSRRGGEVSADA